MHNETYPQGTVAALLETGLVRDATKAVLNKRLRLTERPANPLFSDTGFALLQAVCHRLFPQTWRFEKVPLPQMLEYLLIAGAGEGWRYDALPPINETMVHGLSAVDAEAVHRFDKSFVALDDARQDNILQIVQSGDVIAVAWRVPSNLFFTELLVRLTEQYYSHPLAKDEIGDVSFADGQGWHHLGLNNLETHEPDTIKPDA